MWSHRMYSSVRTPVIYKIRSYSWLLIIILYIRVLGWLETIFIPVVIILFIRFYFFIFFKNVLELYTINTEPYTELSFIIIFCFNRLHVAFVVEIILSCAKSVIFCKICLLQISSEERSDEFSSLLFYT